MSLHVGVKAPEATGAAALLSPSSAYIQIISIYGFCVIYKLYLYMVSVLYTNYIYIWFLCYIQIISIYGFCVNVS